MTTVRAWRRCGLLLAVLALVSQVALGAVVWPDGTGQDRIAALDALSVVCQGRAPGPNSPRPHPAPHPTDASLCPSAAAFAVPLAVLGGGPTLPPPRASLAVSTGRVLLLALLPGRVPQAAWPRGPPSLA